MRAHITRIDWRTCALIAGCYGIWTIGLWAYGAGLWWLSLPLMAVMAAFHTSLQHETIHGHPTPWPVVNEALVSLPLAVLFPYRRYRDLHLQHHRDEHLTDPYEDPESYFWAQDDADSMPRWVRWIFTINNCLLGRLTIGPFLTLLGFTKTEVRRIRHNETGVRQAWALHAGGLIALVAILSTFGIPFWAYVFGALYPAIALTSLRSFAEHQAAEEVGARTAVVEAHPFWALLYLNNNLHIVHHASPHPPRHQLPRLYMERRAQYLAANGNTLFHGYGQIARLFGLRTKQPVDHPFIHRSDTDPAS